MKWTELPMTTFVWSGATILLYFPNRQLHRRVGKWWTSPLMLTPILLVGLAVELHISYTKYIRATRWLVSLLGAVTVAFAIPIYEQRKMISANWKLLTIGLLVGSVTSVRECGLRGRAESMENMPAFCYLHPELVTALMEILAPKPVKKNCLSRKKRRQMSKTYYDHYADLSMIQQKQVAIIGYGIQGHAYRRE